MKTRRVIVGPLVTEKLGKIMEKSNVVAFKVDRDANKIEIRRAVEELGGGKVKVVGVRTLNYDGKLKRLGRFVGRRAAWKKAIVTLAEGQSLPELS